jgi:hypothetical protein
LLLNTDGEAVVGSPFDIDLDSSNAPTNGVLLVLGTFELMDVLTKVFVEELPINAM